MPRNPQLPEHIDGLGHGYSPDIGVTLEAAAFEAGYDSYEAFADQDPEGYQRVLRKALGIPEELGFDEEAGEQE